MRVEGDNDLDDKPALLIDSLAHYDFPCNSEEEPMAMTNSRYSLDDWLKSFKGDFKVKMYLNNYSVTFQLNICEDVEMVPVAEDDLELCAGDNMCRFTLRDKKKDSCSAKFTYGSNTNQGLVLPYNLSWPSASGSVCQIKVGDKKIVKYTPKCEKIKVVEQDDFGSDDDQDDESGSTILIIVLILVIALLPYLGVILCCFKPKKKKK